MKYVQVITLDLMMLRMNCIFQWDDVSADRNCSTSVTLTCDELLDIKDLVAAKYLSNISSQVDVSELQVINESINLLVVINAE